MSNLPFGRIGLMRQEQFPKLFHVYVQQTATSERGREHIEEPVLKLELRCILSIAKPDEIERFSQLGVAVTHTIFQRGPAEAKENDIFALVKQGKEVRFFRVQAVHNKGELDIDTTYYCEERSDRHDGYTSRPDRDSQSSDGQYKRPAKQQGSASVQ